MIQFCRLYDKLCGALVVPKCQLPGSLESDERTVTFFSHRAAHVGMLSIVAPINVRALFGALDPRVPLDPLADLKLILAVGLRAEVYSLAGRRPRRSTPQLRVLRHERLLLTY